MKGAQRKDNMARYYRLHGDEKSKESNRLKASDGNVSKEEEEEEIDEAELRWARMRGLVGPDTSSSSSSSEEGSEDEMEDEEEAEDKEEGERLAEELDAAQKEWGVGALAANPLEPIPLLPDATARLACVDLDWDHIRSVDILVALRSFLPKGGSITKVTVYPSDYGLEKIAEEATTGPQGIWRSGSHTSDNAGDDDNDSADEDQIGSSDGSDSDDNEVDLERLRLYERSKLRWYYAIVECDSAATANTLYEECDGMEIMKSACKFDLRFVPDDQTFENRQIRDSATHVPADYEAPVFQTKALQHTNVELTWDKEDESRKKALTKKLTVDELKDDDFKAYLATDSDDGDDDGEENGEDDPEAVRQRYLRLALLAGDKETENGKGGKKDEDEVDLEVTFEPGLESLAGRLAAKKEEAGRGGETVWEAYLRRKKEKKAEARRMGKHNVDSSDDDDDDFSDYSSEEHGDGKGKDPFDDPFFKSDGDGVNTRKVKRQGKKEEKARGRKKGAGRDDNGEDSNRAELEMLLMDQHQLLENKAQTAERKSDDKDAPIGTKKSVLKVKKNAKRLVRRRTERDRGSDDDEIGGAGFAVDLDDPRFKGLFASPDFALDPTDPRFAKAGPNAARIASEVAKRRSAMVGARQSAAADKETTIPKPMNAASTKDKESNGELKLMVASLKRKAKAAPSAEGFPKHKR